MTRVFAASCAKDLSDPDSNEDSYILRLGQGRAAVFDGASESFAARRWSRTLACRWARLPDDDWWAQARIDYSDHVDSLSMSWAQEAAAERGSYATIVAITATATELEVTAVGDSCAFLIEGDSIVWSFPLDREDQFTSAPEAIGTTPDESVPPQDVLRHGTARIAPAQPRWSAVLLATDALSAWLLSDDPDLRRTRLAELLGCQTPDEFNKLVARERASGNLKVDDCTVVLLKSGALQ